MNASVHPKTPKNALRLIRRHDPSKYIGIKFAIPQGLDGFGSERPPKWGHIRSYHAGTYTILCDDHVKVVAEENVLSKTKISNILTLDDAEFDKLREQSNLDRIIRAEANDGEGNKKTRRASIDLNVVLKNRRRFVDLKFTIAAEGSWMSRKSEKVNYHFLMITDFSTCNSGKNGRTRDVWTVTDENNNQYFLFYQDLMHLISQQVGYDIKSNELTTQTISRHIVEYRYFDPFILLIIFVNCVTLIVEKEYDECDEDVNIDCEEPKEDLWYIFNIGFTSIFFVEMALKMRAYGLLNASNPVGYFNDAWNYLDFAVVIEGILSIAIPGGGAGLSGVRALRILRPLRAVKRLPKLKQIVDAFVKALPLLKDTLVICFFFFLIFAICAVQVFLGMSRTRCFDRETGSLNEDIEFTCGGGFKCPSTDYCGAHVENPNMGVTSFDNVLVSFLTIFQAITLEGWVDIMYMGMDSVSMWTWIFFVFMIFIGSFVIINLTLAIILSKFNEGKAEMIRENSKKAKKEKAALFLRMREAECMVKGLSLDDEEDSSKVSDFSCDDDNDDKTETKTSSVMVFLKLHHPGVRKICVATWFDILMCALILGNMLAIACDHYPQSESFEDNLEVSNIVFTLIFTAEVLFKWVGLGLADYFADGMNILDFVIVVVGLIEILFLGSSSFTAFRALRFGRLVKLIRFMKSLQDILRVLVRSLEGIFYVSMLLLLFIVIYSILGMQFFQHKLSDGEGGVPRNNYDTFHWAFVSTFQVLAGENWPALLYDGIVGSTWLTGTVFYVSWVIIGQFVLLNLFLAVIMANFDDMGDDNDEEEEEETKSAEEEGKKDEEQKLEDKEGETKSGDLSVQDLTKRKFEVSKAEQQAASEAERNIHLQGEHKTNLCFVTVGSHFHERSVYIALHPRFNNFILLLILLSSLALAMECPATYDPDHEDGKYSDEEDDKWIMAFYILELIFATIFTIEAIIKCCAFGFIMHPNSYLRNGWNILDFIVVVAAIVDLSADLDGVSALRIIRLVRVLRPLRVVKNNPGLKRVINALILSLESLKDIFLVLIFVWILFAMLGVQFFKGRLYTCSDPNFPADTSRYGVCALDPVDNTTCLTTNGNNIVYVTPPCDDSVTTFYSYPSLALTNNTDSSGTQRTWTPIMDMNFDNVYEGFLVLFVSAHGEGWPDVMFAVSDITGIDRTPKLNNAPYYAYYWVIYVTIVCFFFVELFVGALFTKFSEMKERDGVSHLFLTDEQAAWVKHQKKLMKSEPKKPKAMVYFFPEYYRRVTHNEVPRDGLRAFVVLKMNTLRKRLFGLVTSNIFESFIFFCIFANTLVIAMPYYEMGEHYTVFLKVANFIFTIIFALEMVLKHYALSFIGYWTDAWNAFDGVLVLFSLVDILFSSVFPASVFRVLRIGRVFGKLAKIGRVGRIAKALSGVIKILGTLYLTLPAIGNVGTLLLLFYFLFAVAGVNMFGDLELEAPHSSFKNFPEAMLTLFRISTGEDWQNLMYACYEGEYGKYPAAVYFLLFVFGSAFVTLNVFVAIIAENFEEDAVEDMEGDGDEDEDEDDDQGKIVVIGASDENQLMKMQTKDLAKRFKTAWSNEDPDATHFIPKSRLRALLTAVGHPGGINRKCTDDEYETYLLGLNLSLVSDFINYHDVLVALHRYLFKHVADTIPKELHAELEIDHATVQSKIIQQTEKRSKKSSRLGKKSSKRMILRHISETLDKEAKDSEGDHKSEMLRVFQRRITFNILLRRVQRRWRAKLKKRKDDQKDND